MRSLDHVQVQEYIMHYFSCKFLDNIQYKAAKSQLVVGIIYFAGISFFILSKSCMLISKEINLLFYD